MTQIILTGRLVCANEAELAAVVAHLPRHAELSRAEEGCLAFEVTQTGDPLVWTVAERFVDRASFDAHQVRTKNIDWGRATAGITREYDIAEAPGP